MAAAWRRRMRAPLMTLPAWARENPDRLLYSSNTAGRWDLYAWDRVAEDHRRVTDRPEGTRHGALDPTGEAIWWFDDERGSEHGRWVVEPFAGGERRLAAPELPVAFSAGLALGKGFAVVGSSRDDGATIHLVTPDGAPRLLYRHREVARVAGLARDEARLCLTHAEHGDSRHPALRVLDLEGRAVADLWDGRGRGLFPGDWSPVPGDRRLIVHHQREDLLRPLIWSPETGESRALGLDLGGEVTAAWYPDAAALLLVEQSRGRSALYRYDLTSDLVTPIPIEPGSVGGARVRPDGEIWHLWTRSDTPSELRAGERALLRPSGEPAPPGVAYTAIEVDGVPAFIAEPPGPGPHPVLFRLHGGPHAADVDTFSPVAQAWVDHGFAVVFVNYRGSTGYGRAWRDALQGNPGFTELEDVMTVYRAVVARGNVDRQRIVLSGASWGGYLTLLGLGTQPDAWALGIAEVPVADSIAAYEDEAEPLKALDRSLFGGAPAERPELYRERSPISYVERVRAPVLILAGRNDSRCPIRQIDRYVERLRQLGTPHAYLTYDAGHGSLVTAERIRQLEAEIAFTARHLGTRPPL